MRPYLGRNRSAWSKRSSKREPFLTRAVRDASGDVIRIAPAVDGRAAGRRQLDLAREDDDPLRRV